MNDTSVSAYYELMVKSAVLLGAKESVAKKQMMEVLEFETLLANVRNVLSTFTHFSFNY